jgi:drug/metabolite transporter (DMT)-like permease
VWRKERLFGAACVATAAGLWGLWPAWVRGAAGGTGSAVVALLTGGAVSWPWALAAGARRPRAGGRVDGRAVAGLVALGLANAANVWLYFRAISEGAVAPAILAHYLAPVLVALAAPRVLGETPSRRTPVALALAIGGTAVLLLAGGGASMGQGARHAAMLGAASAVFYATTVLLSKRISRVLVDVELFSWQCLVAAAVLWPVSTVPRHAIDWARPAVGGIVSSLAAGLIYYQGLRRLPAERVGVLSYLEIASGVLVGWIAFGERPGWGALVGGAGILAAGLLVITAPHGEG